MLDTDAIQGDLATGPNAFQNLPLIAQADGAAPSPSPAIGTVSKVSGQVSVTHADGSQEALKGGVAIKVGDVINTGADGKVGLTFDDGSTFALGAKGHMSVDEMALPSAQGLGGKETLSIDSGSFSFSSGAIAKAYPDAMLIKTPVASIGIRGTTGAGTAGPEGTPNSISLLPDPDGTVGQVSVTTQSGTQTLSQPGATTQVSSAFAPPPPPVILSPQQIQQQYGDTLQTLPPPPSPEQLQQLQQQRQADAQTEAEQQAADAAAQQADGEQAATDGNADAQAQNEAEAVREALGEAGATLDDALANFFDSAFGDFGPAGDAFGDLLTELNDLFATFDPFGDQGAGDFNLGNLITELGEDITALIDETIQDVIDDLEDQALSQDRNQFILGQMTEETPFVITTTDGETDYIVGRENTDDSVEISGTMGLGDTFVDYSSGDNDTLTLDTGTTNVGWRVAGIEHLDLTATTGPNTFIIGSDGSTFISLASGAGVDSISSSALSEKTELLATGHQQWSITGNLGADNLNMGNGTDKLFLLTGGTHSVTLNGVEEIYMTAGSAIDLTLLVNTGGMTLSGTGGADHLTLAAGNNTVTVSGIETLTGGSGADSMTISGLTSASGGDGDDNIILTSITDFGSGDYLSGDGGTDTLTLHGAAGTVDFSAGTIQYFENMVIATESGSTTVSWAEGQPGSWQTISGRASETDILKLADASSVFDLTGIALSNIDEIHLGTGNDTVRFDDALGNGSSIASTLTFVDNDASSGDSDTVAFFVQKAGSTLDASGITLSNIEMVSLQAVDDSGAGDEHEGNSAWNGSSMTIIGSSVKNNITLLSGTNTVTGGASDDNVNGGSGIDVVNGGQGNDTLSGNGGADTLNGGMGNDTLIGGAGADTLTGDAGNDVFRYTAISEFGDTITSLDFSSGAGDVFSFTSAAAGGLSSVTAGDFATTTNMGAFTFSGQHFVFAATIAGGPGALWFSANGTGSDMVEVAEFGSTTGTMTEQDIIIAV